VGPRKGSGGKRSGRGAGILNRQGWRRKYRRREQALQVEWEAFRGGGQIWLRMFMVDHGGIGGARKSYCVYSHEKGLERFGQVGRIRITSEMRKPNPRMIGEWRDAFSRNVKAPCVKVWQEGRRGGRKKRWNGEGTNSESGFLITGGSCGIAAE